MVPPIQMMTFYNLAPMLKRISDLRKEFPQQLQAAKWSHQFSQIKQNRAKWHNQKRNTQKPAKKNGCPKKKVTSLPSYSFRCLWASCGVWEEWWSHCDLHQGFLDFWWYVGAIRLVYKNRLSTCTLQGTNISPTKGTFWRLFSFLPCGIC